MISNEQRRAILDGLEAAKSDCTRPAPQSCSEWADENFYLSPESSNSEGRWETLPFQVAVLNSFGNDDIRVINVRKSARVGYTKMLLAAMGYTLAHKKRNQIIFQPKNSDAEEFMKDSIETMIRDVPTVKALAPWEGKKHRDSTKNRKVFANRRQILCRGGEAARNYRRVSTDSVLYDELASFQPDVEREGSPLKLGDKRAEASPFPKSIRGSTPKLRADLFDQACEGADETFRRHVPCPLCDEFQALEFGGKGAEFGLKWSLTDDGAVDEVAYTCAHCQGKWEQARLYEVDKRGEWRSDSGMVTRDGETFFRDGDPVDTPRSVTWVIWSIYLTYTSWRYIVEDFLSAKDDPIELKTFVNTTLGESWEDAAANAVEWEKLYARREFYRVPNEIVYLTIGWDNQDDRFEWEVVGWGRDEQSWSIDYGVLVGNPGDQVLWDMLASQLRKPYQRDDGTVLTVGTCLMDSGGHYTDNVYEFSRRNGLHQFVPCKGASQPGKPIATWPVNRSRKGVYLVQVGTDNAKDLIYSRLQLEATQEGEFPPGYCHFPHKDTHGPDFFKQITAERKALRRVNGRAVYRYELPSGRRNEALDCRVYAMAALRVAQQRKGIDLATIEPARSAPPRPRKRGVMSEVRL